MYHSNGLQSKREMHSFKVVLLGDTNVGKTSVLVRFVENTFQDLQQATIGAAFQSVDITIPYTNSSNEDDKLQDDKQHIARLQIWDTAGQEQYHSLASMYYRGCHAAIIVYDVSNLESFKRAKVWIHELNQSMADDDWEKVVVILVGNKLDLCEDIYSSKYTTEITTSNSSSTTTTTASGTTDTQYRLSYTSLLSPEKFWIKWTNKCSN